MTERMFTDDLIGKTVMTPGGYPLGLAEDFVIETETGEIMYVLVKLTASPKPGQRIDDKGRAVIAFNSVKVTETNLIMS